MSLQFGPKSIPFADSACWKDPAEVVELITRGKIKGQAVLHTRRSSPRTATWIAGFVVHTTSGTVTKVRPGLIESLADWTYYKYMRDSKRSVSWHATIDLDGSIIQHADPWQRCWHASQVNDYTGGCELVQTKERELCAVQLDAFVRFMDVWTRETGVPRIIPWRVGKPYRGRILRASSSHGAGRHLCAIYGHRNIWGAKGPYRSAGDPGDGPFEALAKAGYLALDVEAGEDVAYWKDWQRKLGLREDGVAGPDTRLAMLKHSGLPYGMVVFRPGDDDGGTPAWLLRAAP